MAIVQTHPRILFPHIAKTGGTSLLYHFRSNWSEDRIFVYGAHSRVRLFFKGKYQFEELNAEEKAKYRVIQGHGVNQATIAIQDDPNFKLMVVLREPLSLTRSRFNQRVLGSERRGKEMNSEKFMKNVATNPLTKKLLKDFPDFVDSDVDNDADKAISVLKKFDYVVTTENLNSQLRSMFKAYGLPEEIERRRVADKKVPLDATDEEIRAVTRCDRAVYEVFNHVVENDGTQHNAHGFDAAGKQRVVEHLIAQNTNYADDIRANCYKELARGLCSELRAEAALAILEEDRDTTPIADKDAFKKELEKTWAKHLESGLSDKAKERSENFRKRALVKRRRQNLQHA